MLVETAVRPGDLVLDAGGGTGSTALLAARGTGPQGHVVLFDLSVGMVREARGRVTKAGLDGQISFVIGAMEHPPFRTSTFDVVLSTYSLCPLTDPRKGAIALYDLVRPGGLLGAAHSAEPRNAIVRRIGHAVESLAWRLPALSMGCRPVCVLPALQRHGAIVEDDRHIGVPLWPFEVFVVRQPASPVSPGPSDQQC